MFLFGEGVEDQAVGFVEEVSQQIVGDGTLRADGVPVGLVHVIARQNVRILPAEEVALGGVELQGDVIRLVLIVQADGGEQFAADLIADPVSVRLQVLCDTGLLQEIVVNPGIWHRGLLSFSGQRSRYSSQGPACRGSLRRSRPCRPSYGSHGAPPLCF